MRKTREEKQREHEVRIRAIVKFLLKKRDMYRFYLDLSRSRNGFVRADYAIAEDSVSPLYTLYLSDKYKAEKKSLNVSISFSGSDYRKRNLPIQVWLYLPNHHYSTWGSIYDFKCENMEREMLEAWIAIEKRLTEFKQFFENRPIDEYEREYAIRQAEYSKRMQLQNLKKETRDKENIIYKEYEQAIT